MSEFDIIREVFAPLGASAREDTIIGIGDDAAVLAPPPGAEIVMAMDVLNEGIHFPVATPAHAVGHKSLAVNLSDLAAMGSRPLWFTLGLSLPDGDTDWLRDFAHGLGSLAAEHNITLVGGDTTRGTRSIAVNVCGAVSPGRALTRGGASAGDIVCVTGPLGEAGLALDALNQPASYSQAEIEILNQSLNYPTPRVATGLALSGIASAAIDISDGLAQDLGHVINASRVGAVIRVADIPLGDVYANRVDEIGYETAVTFGDDYELLVTVPESRLDQAISAVVATSGTLVPIGHVTDGSTVSFVDSNGRELPVSGGFDHFKSN